MVNELYSSSNVTTCWPRNGHKKVMRILEFKVKAKFQFFHVIILDARERKEGVTLLEGL
jgi:hypothetical protein